YLTHPQLMPKPQLEPPWKRLWEGQEDRAFVTTMGFDVNTFRFLLVGPGRFAEHWDNIPIPRSDVSSTGKTQLGRCNLDAAGALTSLPH
ncbi:hypothetical protein C8J55DRAFT_385300, partial [Lentinula edodes]